MKSRKVKIFFPKNWKKLSDKEQKEWINAYFMPKEDIPEPIFYRTDMVEKGEIKLKSGAKISFPKEKLSLTAKNPNLVREYESWVDKWLITVFHDKKYPFLKIVSIGNPYLGKWVAQELSLSIWRDFLKTLWQIGHKYRFFNKKKDKKRNKKSNFPLSLREYIRGKKE